MNTITYVAHVNKVDDGFVAEFPDVPGAEVKARTKEEVLIHARAALCGVLATMLDDKKPLPEPKTKPDESKGLVEVNIIVQ